MSEASATRPDLSRVRALVLAGGAGVRLFPLRKVLSDPTGSGRTLVQQAFDRVVAPLDQEAGAPLVPPERFYVVTSAALRGPITTQLGLPEDQILVEPARRNTWPAVLWGLAHLRQADPGGTVALLTADHLVGDVPAFRETLGDAIALAQREDAIVTLGIEPSGEAREWVGFGALRAAEPPRAGRIAPVERFEEKPDEEQARRMIEQGGWCWNSGMFVFRIDVAERVLGRLQPGMERAYREITAALRDGRPETAARRFDELPGKIPHPRQPERIVDNSIDYAIMMPLVAGAERGVRAYVIEADFPWRDLGSWRALRRVLAADRDGNVRLGEVRLDRVRGSIVVAEPGCTIEAANLAGVVIVHAAHGELLVIPEHRLDELGSLVTEARSSGPGATTLRESEQGRITPGDRWVVVLGLDRLEIVCEGRTARVRALPGFDREDRSSLLDRLAGEAQPLRPHVSHNAWGGNALPGLLGISAGPDDEPAAEAWLTSTHDDGRAGLRRAPLSLAELVEARPQVLGWWSQTLFGAGLPVFAKFLSTRFPPRVHLGLRPTAVRELGGPSRLREQLAERLRRERNLLRDFRERLDLTRLAAAAEFDRFRGVYESWAVRLSGQGWEDAGGDTGLVRRLRPWLRAGVAPAALGRLVRELGSNRARTVALFNEVDLRREHGRLLLSRSGAGHSLFGLSHQIHPRDRADRELRELYTRLRELSTRGAGGDELRLELAAAAPRIRELRHSGTGPPKNEAWLPFACGEQTVILEPQQTSNTTRSLLDLYTPFVYREGGLAFRKGDPARGLSDAEIDTAVAEIELQPSDVDGLRCEPLEVPVPGRANRARLFRLVDDPARWPYFAVYRLELQGDPRRPARWEAAPPEDSFQQWITLGGEARWITADGEVTLLRPGAPLFVPASLDGGQRIEADGCASLVLLALPLPVPLFPRIS